jgi:hypothetical protein
MGNGGIAPSILKLTVIFGIVVNITPRPLYCWDITSVPTEKEAS